MDRRHLSIRTAGQILFTQRREPIKPGTKNEFTTRLAVDEPSQSHLPKPLDNLIATSQSKLSYLAHPVGVYVQPAETDNHALNSLALRPSRYAHVSLDLLS